MKPYIKPRSTAVAVAPSAFVAASRVVDFTTGVTRTAYKDDLVNDPDGNPESGGASADGYTPIEWSVVH